MAQLLTYRDGKFLWLGGYDTKDTPKGAGFWWDNTRKRWWTDKYDVAMRLSSYCDPAAAEELNAHQRRQREELESSMATDADINVPSPPGLSYMPYQRAGIAYASRRQAALIADDMGLGKTIQAIGVANLDRSIKRILVICPASLKINWAREMDKWLVKPDITIGIAESQRWPGTDVVIINYDIVDRHLDRIHNTNWDLLILDEAHYLKSPDAKRTKLILGHKKWDNYANSWQIIQRPIEARRRLALTGTPILNRPHEMWTLVDFCLRHVPYGSRFEHFRSKTRFYERYEGYGPGKFGYEFKGPQNLEELQREARRAFMIRRLKSQVLTELPPKRRQVIEVPSEGYEALLEREREAYAAAEERVAEAQAKMLMAKASEDEEAYQEAVRELRQAYSVAFEEISKVRHQVGLATLEAAEGFIREILDTGNKVVFFCHHRDVVEKLYKLCSDILGGDRHVVKLYGGMSGSAKQESTDRFQKDPDVRVFIGSIQAAGVGLTLTASSHVVFLELDWVPANVIQAEDRCHRIGQPDSVLVQHLVLEGSLTSRMAQVLVEKQNVIDRALNGDITSAYANEPITPAEVESSGVSEAKRMTRHTLREEAKMLSQREVSVIRAFVQYLAAVCDFADKKDDCGFNRHDAKIGHLLAIKPEFTASDAVIAKRICRKYKRQLVQQFGESMYSEIYRESASDGGARRRNPAQGVQEDVASEVFKMQGW